MISSIGTYGTSSVNGTTSSGTSSSSASTVATKSQDSQQQMSPDAIVAYIKEQTGCDEGTIKDALKAKFGEPDKNGTAPTASDIQTIINQLQSNTTSSAQVGTKLNTTA